MNKTIRAFVLPFLLFFTLSTVTAPARAVLPLIAGGVALMTEGGMAANGLAALTVGTVAGMIYLGNLQSGTGASDGSGSYMEIPLGTSRSRPMATPPGYTAPANNDAQPTPPNTVAAIAKNSHPAAIAACQALANSQGLPYHSSYVLNDTTAQCYWGTTYVYELGQVTGDFKLCPAGYTWTNSTTCTMTTPSQVMKPADGRCHILASVAGFTIDPQDPECSGLAAQTGTIVTPSTITQSKPGTLTNGKVTINADGSRTIVYSSGNTTNNTTTITTINMIPAAGGQTAQVTGSSTVVVAGTGNLAAPATPAAPLTIPDDYNREVTQGQIKTGIDALHGDLDSSAFAQPAASAQTASELSLAENKKITDVLDASVSSYDNFKLLDWSTWIPVLPASSCSPITGNVMGRIVSIDLCPKIAMLNELIGWMLAVYASWSVVMMAFRRD